MKNKGGKTEQNYISNSDRLGCVNRIISSINQIIIHTADKKTLLKKICCEAVKEGGFPLVWIGLVEENSDTIIPVAFCGKEAAYLKKIKISLNSKKPEGKGPTARALQTKKPFTCNNWQTAAYMKPWRSIGKAHHFQSSAAFPLIIDNRTIGAINFYSSKINNFTDREVKLLEELTANISFSIYSLTQQENRRKTEELIAESEKKFQGLFEATRSCVVIYKPTDKGDDFVISDMNKAAEITENIAKRNAVGKSVRKVFPGVVKMGLFDVFKKVWMTGKESHFPITFYKDNRISGWRENQVIRLPSGEIAAVYDDLTEKKQAEERLIESEKKYRTLFESSADFITIVDLNGHFLEVNNESLKASGYSKEEFLKLTTFDVNPPELKKLAPKLIAELKTRGHHVFESVFLGKDGKKTPVEINNILIDYLGKPAILSIGRDITERKLSEKRILDFTTELEGKIAELERFKKVTVGRELKMLELKDKIRSLEKKLKE